MYLSVIVPTCNRYDLLRKCLNNLLPSFQTLGEDFYEIIVTDDSIENDEVKNLIEEYPQVKFLEGKRKGPAANRNNGAKQAKGDWFVFIDDDCLPEKDLLLAYYAEISKGIYSGIEGCIDADRPQERFDEQSPINLNGGCFWSCNIAVKKDVFKKLEGFDEGFPYAALEDTDFAERLKKVTNTTFLIGAKVIHPWRRAVPFKSYKKWMASASYAMKKSNQVKNFRYRIKMINLFIGTFLNNTRKIIYFRFKGIGFYFELIWLHFLNIFV